MVCVYVRHQVDSSEVDDVLLQSLASSVSGTSSRLGGTREIFVAHKEIANGSLVPRILSQRKFSSSCGSVCVGSVASELSSVRCQNGYLVTSDYRGQTVFAGYACLPDAECGVPPFGC